MSFNFGTTTLGATNTGGGFAFGAPNRYDETADRATFPVEFHFQRVDEANFNIYAITLHRSVSLLQNTVQMTVVYL